MGERGYSMDSLDIVKKFYDETVNNEWERLDHHKVEFELSKRYMNRYIKPNDKVLDLGGGPGKYSLYLAERGCDVTLADLSPKNVDFALKKAKSMKGRNEIASFTKDFTSLFINSLHSY